MTPTIKYLDDQAVAACLDVRQQMVDLVGQHYVEQAAHHLKVDVGIEDEDLGAFYRGVMWAVIQAQEDNPPMRTARTIMSIVGEKLT